LLAYQLAASAGLDELLGAQNKEILTASLPSASLMNAHNAKAGANNPDR